MKQLPDKFFVHTPTVELYQLVQKRLFALGIKWWNGETINGQFNYGDQTCLGYQDGDRLMYGDTTYYNNEKGYEKVSISDLFLVEIPKKEITITILPWTVVVRENEVDIGCKKGIDIGEAKTLARNVEVGKGTTRLPGIKIESGRYGFTADGKDVTWAVWDKFMDAFNKALA